MASGGSALAGEWISLSGLPGGKQTIVGCMDGVDITGIRHSFYNRQEVFVMPNIQFKLTNTDYRSYIVLKDKAFDAYPFILLNLVLSCIAAVQAPLIMMSQNRQEAKDRERAENDFKVNLKSELIIDDLHRKMDLVLENQKKINRRLDLLEQAENISPEQKKNIVSSSKKTLPQDNDSLT